MSLPANPASSLDLLPIELRDLAKAATFAGVIYENVESGERASLYRCSSLTPFLRVDEKESDEGKVDVQLRDACQIIVAPTDRTKFEDWQNKAAWQKKIEYLGFGLYAVDLLSIDELSHLIRVKDPLFDFQTLAAEDGLDFEFIESNQVIHRTNPLPRESVTAFQWALQPSTCTQGGIDLQPGAPTGHRNTIIALIDGAVLTTHQEFVGATIRDPINIPHPGLPASPDRHGTACAGVIFAQGVRIRGVSPSCTMLPINIFCTDNPQCTLSSYVVKAVCAAKENNAKIASLSLTITQQCMQLRRAMARCNEILFINAIGSLPQDIALQPVYPASFGLDNQISVLAHDRRGRRHSLTNFDTAKRHGHIAAPGVDVMACDNTVSDYRQIDQTSIATPHVAGVCALVWSSNPGWSVAQVRQHIFDTAYKRPNFASFCFTEGTLNAAAAITGQITSCGEEPPHP
jgi:hypothetical protein